MAHKWILETDRLRLREFTGEDGEAMYHMNMDPEVIRYTGEPPFESVEVAKEIYSNYPDYGIHGFGRWVCEEKESNALIGWCGLKMETNGMVDIGYRFFKEYWSKGYATESAKACLDFGFNKLKLKGIVGRAAKSNPASIRVFEKIGMEFWKDEYYEEVGDCVAYKIGEPQVFIEFVLDEKN